MISSRSENLLVIHACNGNRWIDRATPIPTADIVCSNVGLRIFKYHSVYRSVSIKDFVQNYLSFEINGIDKQIKVCNFVIMKSLY